MTEPEYGRPVLVRTKHDLFHAQIAGEWTDNRSGLSGPMVSVQPGVMFNIDWKRIVRFTDTDEIPWGENDD